MEMDQKENIGLKLRIEKVSDENLYKLLHNCEKNLSQYYWHGRNQEAFEAVDPLGRLKNWWICGFWTNFIIKEFTQFENAEKYYEFTFVKW